MKNILFISIAILPTMASQAQQVVIHPDMISQQSVNTATARMWLGLYENRLEDIRSHRQRTLAAMATIERIQQQVFEALTRVQDAVQDGKTVWYISKKIPGILSSLSDAVQLAAQKPQLLPLVVREANLCQLRMVKLMQYLQEHLLRDNRDVLMDPARRGELIRKVYDELRVTEALAEHIVQTLKMSRLQDAVQSVVPYKDYLQMDKAIIDGILRQWTY